MGGSRWGTPDPRRTVGGDGDVRGRRPVVAILDTGCVRTRGSRAGRRGPTAKLDGYGIGHTDPTTDIEVHGDLTGPFDGSVDRIAGHGTFIAGLVHQACPDAEILSWRAIPAKAPLVESEWLTTLAQVIELVRRHREGDAGGHPIDVVSLSMGYYHENESGRPVRPDPARLLDELSRLGVAVVCSAGNDATNRPSYPAAFAPWRVRRPGTLRVRRDHVPVVSVGALNPNATDALFTNTGEWVRSYAPGAGSLSTMPGFEGGFESVARTRVDDRVRESIDPDDYRSRQDDDGHGVGGFASGAGRRSRHRSSPGGSRPGSGTC